MDALPEARAYRATGVKAKITAAGIQVAARNKPERGRR